jgi:hypothetical protein
MEKLLNQMRPLDLSYQHHELTDDDNDEDDDDDHDGHELCSDGEILVI